MPSDILVIGDVQHSPGRPIDHLKAIGNWIVKHKPDVVVNIGDTYDMPSLSQYETKTRKALEHRCVWSDLEAGNQALTEILKPYKALSDDQKRKQSNFVRTRWNPRFVYTLGNHEYRIQRFIDECPEFDMMLNSHQLLLDDWEVHDFLKPVKIEGILFCHYFTNPLTGRPYSGTIQNRLNHIKESFVQGHQQGALFHRQLTLDRTLTALQNGSFYMHDEDYMGHQGNRLHWRGCHLLKGAHEGDYNLQELSLAYLLKHYL